MTNPEMFCPLNCANKDKYGICDSELPEVHLRKAKHWNGALLPDNVMFCEQYKEATK